MRKITILLQVKCQDRDIVDIFDFQEQVEQMTRSSSEGP